MKTIPLFLLLAVLAGCAIAPVPELGSRVITLTASRVAECETQGGCGLVSRLEIEALADLAFEAGRIAEARRRGAI